MTGVQTCALPICYAEIGPDLDKINTAGKHLLGIINEILDLSKIEAGHVDLSIEKFLVQDIIGTVVDTVQPLITTNANTLIVNSASDVGIIETDITRLRQIQIGRASCRERV